MIMQNYIILTAYKWPHVMLLLFLVSISPVIKESNSESDTDKQHQSVEDNEEPLFKSWSTQSGLDDIDINQRNYGVAIADVDFDGTFEFIIAGFSGPNIVLHYNKTTGKLENIAVKGGLYEDLRDDTGQAIGLCACDIDGDGKEEIYFLNTNNAYAGMSSYPDKLFKWREGRYVDLYSDAVNVNMTAKNFAGRSVSCLDRYGRGKYGFMIASYAYRSSGTFALIEMDEFHSQNNVDSGHIVLKDAAEESGLKKSTGGRSIAVGPILNSDGKSDIYFGNEGSERLGNYGDNFLFKNIGNGTFIDVAKQLDLTDNFESVRGVALADFNNDGNLDIVYSNWDGPTRLYIQSVNADGTRKFQDVATPHLQKKAMVRTVMVADFDNDKSLEIVINNIDGNDKPEPNVGFKVTSYGPTNLVGISKISLGDAIEKDMYGTGGAYFDIDGDGRLEMLLSHGESVPQPLEIYKVNLGSNYNWIRVFPRTKYGAPARGATVSVKTRSGDLLTRVIDGGSGYLCQMEPIAHFGLRLDTAISLTVKYPDGKVVEKSLKAENNNKLIIIYHTEYKSYQRAQRAIDLSMTGQSMKGLNNDIYNHTEL